MARKTKKTVQPVSGTKEHITRLIDWMSQGVYEKEQIIAIALLTAVAGENIFLLGPPGTAKSLVASRLKMVFKDGRSFDYLMSRFSTPDEIFGPISISRLKNEDRYERLTDGYLPDAHVVFLDEIWKAGPSIQNTLLTAVNEHIFHNGGRAHKLPMKVLIAASNELPAKDEGLEALWDRFLMRMVSNCITADAAFFKMIATDSTAIEPLDDDLYITDELYSRWQQESKDVKIAPAVTAAIKALRKILAEKENEDGNSLRYYVSDRRWRKAFRLMQTSAYLNGRSEIDLSDYLLLTHSFWNDVESIPVIVEAFAASIADSMTRQLDKIEKEIRKLLSPQGQNDDPAPSAESSVKSEFVEYDYFYYRIENFPDGEAFFAKWDLPTLSTSAKEGVRYFDTKRNRYIIHSLAPGKAFSNDPNATNIKKVTLEKWANGAIIDGTPYRFERHAAAPGLNVPMPFFQRVKQLGDNFRLLVDGWHMSISANWTDCRNIFLADSDIRIIDKMRKDVDEKIKTIEVKMNNLAGMSGINP